MFRAFIASLIFGLGIGTVLSQPAPTPSSAATACAQNAVTPIIASGQFGLVQCDSLGRPYIVSTGFTPSGNYITPISATTVSAASLLPVGQSIRIYNTGLVAAYVKFGQSNSVTATTSNDIIPAGGGCEFNTDSNTYIAAITASSGTLLNISGGLGSAPGCWGGAPVIPSIPVNTAIPIVTGTMQDGAAALTITGNTWANTPTSFVYQWYDEGSAIGGATSATYSLVDADIGALITVGVIATNAAGSSPQALSAVAGPVLGTTVFYVSSSLGNDTWDGTAPTHTGGTTGPWATVAKVNAQTFTAGTSILFKRGDTWDRSTGPSVLNRIVTPSAGSVGVPIVFGAYSSGAMPAIDGSAAGGTWTASGTPNVWKSVQTFPPNTSTTVTITIASPAVVTWGANLPNATQSVIFATTGTLPTGIVAGTVYYVKNPSGTTFQIAATPTGAAINTSGSQSGVQTAGANGMPFFNANDVGNIIWNPVTLGGSAPAEVVSASVGKMTGGGAGGVWYKPGDGTANIGTTNGNWNFDTDDWTVQIYSSTGSPDVAMPGLRLIMDGSGFITNKDNIIFEDIDFRYMGAALAGTIQSTNISIRDSVAQWIGGGNNGGHSGTNDRAGDGFDPENIYSNVTIERNYIYQIYDGAIAPQLINAGAHDNLKIRNNIIDHFSVGISDLLQPLVATSSNGLYIFNNTLYGVISWGANQRPNGFPSNDGIQFHYNTNLTVSNRSIENNAMGAINRFAAFFFNPPLFNLSFITTVAWDFNSWTRQSAASQVGETGGGGNISMTTWQSTYGFEAHGLIDVAQGFTNAAASNYTPTGGSVLRNSGTNLFSSGVVWDFNHQPRPTTGPFTMGAIQ